jgi:hypothetical protein
MPGTRSFAVRTHALELEGVSCGFLAAVEGGDVSAEVISEAHGDSAFATKSIGPPRYEDVVVQVAFGMTKPFYAWITEALRLESVSHSGRIVSVDARLKPVFEREFEDALITETIIPALDASAKEPAYLTVRFSPGLTRIRKPTGAVGRAGGQKQKEFLASNFRLEIDGLDCSKVSQVAALTIRWTLSASGGDGRRPHRAAVGVAFPDLKVTLAEAGAETWQAWFDDFVLSGNSGERNEKNGALVFLAPDAKELARLTLRNLGIFALRRRAQARAEDALARVTAELYCERMELAVAGDA